MDHSDNGKFQVVKSAIERFIKSLPVVSKTGITKLLENISAIERGQIVKLPRSGLTKTKLNSELIAEGVMYQIIIQGGIEIREQCYVLLLINKIICIPYEKLSKFKHSYTRSSEGALDDCSPDIKWFANLSDCSFKSVSSLFLQAAALESSESSESSSKSNRSLQLQSISVPSISTKLKGELFVVNETCVTNIEPYVVQEERFLVADNESVKDHAYWANSFQ